MFTHSSCGGGLEEILVLISFCVIHYCESGDCSFPSWNGPSPPPTELRSREGEARLGPERLAQPSQALPCCSEGFPGIHRGWWCGCFSEEPTPGIGTLAFCLLPFLCRSITWQKRPASLSGRWSEVLSDCVTPSDG